MTDPRKTRDALFPEFHVRRALFSKSVNLHSALQVAAAERIQANTIEQEFRSTHASRLPGTALLAATARVWSRPRGSIGPSLLPCEH